MKFSKLLNNHVVVRVDRFFGDSIKLQGGMVLFIDTTTQNPRYATTKGTVIQCPDKLICIDPKNKQALEWETEMEIKPGDRVWFQYDAMINAVKNPEMHIVEDNKLYVILNYRWLYVAKRVTSEEPTEGYLSSTVFETIPLNGYCLCVPVYTDEYPELAEHYHVSDLSVNKHQKLPNIMKIIHLAKPNKRYQDKVYSDPEGFTIDDIVLTVKHSDIPLEYDLYRSFDQDREVYRIQRRNMLAIIEIGK